MKNMDFFISSVFCQKRLYKPISILLIVLVFGFIANPMDVSAETCSALELQSDVNNCGTCGLSCYATAVNSNWSCQSGECQFEGCKADFYDLNGDNLCEYACTFHSAQEFCNGKDDNCNGVIDEDVLAPSVIDTCGVNPAATAIECTSGVTLSCQDGAWSCNFPPGVCTDGCSSDDEICDGLDNDCDGLINENVANYGQSCRSDDGLPPPGHGRCAEVGTFICDGSGSTVCSAQKKDCATLSGGCTEACDGIDNDCDGLVDESYLNKGTNASYFVKPLVTRISSNSWIFSYEASRPDATSTSPGFGNGFHCQNCPPGIPGAPVDEPLDGTIACSEPGRLPWFGVSPTEVEQTCNALGGYVCDLYDVLIACEATVSCTWGYAPRGTECLAPATPTKFCNLAMSYDSDPVAEGSQNGLLETGSTEVNNCFADWFNILGNTEEGIFDLTGNLKEITKNGSNVYPLLGGSFRTEVEAGAACTFDFEVAEQNYKSMNTGFRCCFDSDPRF